MARTPEFYRFPLGVDRETYGENLQPGVLEQILGFRTASVSARNKSHEQTTYPADEDRCGRRILSPVP
jgi:hypothetical protein